MRSQTITICIFIMSLASILLLPTVALSFPPNKIDDLFFKKETSSEIVQVVCSDKVDWNSIMLHNPDRIVVDMYGCVFPSVHKTTEVGGAIVSRVRISQNTKRTVRVVLDIKKLSPYHISYLNTRGETTQVLAINLSMPSPPKAPAGKAPSAHAPSPPALKEKAIQTGPKAAVQPKPAFGQKEQPAEKIIVLGEAENIEEQTSPPSAPTKPPALNCRGFIMLKGAQDTRHESPTENEKVFRNRVRLEGKWNPLSRIHSGNLFLLASVDSDYLWFGPENKTRDYDLYLYEGYISWSPGPFYLTLGKQIVRWGKTDQISPVDNLNPQDLRQLIVPDYEDRKIPVLMARMGLHSDSIGVEGVYVPFFEPARIDYFGTDWAVFRHIKADAQRSSLDPATKTYIDTRFVDEDPPSNAFKNGEWGIRLSRTIGNVDLALSYLYAWEHLPFFSSFPIKNFRVAESASFDNMLRALADANPMDEPLEVVYKRSGIGGLEFETTAGPLGLRGEAAYFDNQSFLTNTFTSLRSPVFHYVLGADYSGSNDLYINVQLSHQVILDYDSSILYFKRHNVSLLGELKKGIWENYLEASLKYSLALSEHSYYLCPSIIFKYISNLDVAFGYNLFQGDSDTFFGYYDDNDQVYLTLKYHF